MNRLFILIFAVLLAACATPEQLAQKHLKKAMRLDPGIISKQYTDTTIRDTVRSVIPVTMPGVTINTPGIDIDSLLRTLDSLKRAGKKPEAYVYQDSAVSVSIHKDSAGKVAANIQIKPKTVEVPVMVPYEKTITVPGKTVTVKETKPFYTHALFWVMLLLNIFCVFLALGQRKTN